MKPVGKARRFGNQAERLDTAGLVAKRAGSARARTVGRYQRNALVQGAGQEDGLAAARVTNYADALGIDFGPRLQIVDRAHGPPGPHGQRGPVVVGVGGLRHADGIDALDIGIQIVTRVAHGDHVALQDGRGARAKTAGGLFFNERRKRADSGWYRQANAHAHGRLGSHDERHKLVHYAVVSGRLLAVVFDIQRVGPRR